MNFQEFKKKYEKVPVEEYPNTVPESPVVSVCVQTYQHVNYIKDCLEGILMQKTDFPFEILLGEDASTDGTREICIEYAERYPDKIRLFLHHRENNIKIWGSPTGRFILVSNLNLAKGKYIALCEGDDYWTDPLKLQKQVDFLENNPEYVISFHKAKNVDIVQKGIADKSQLGKQVDRVIEPKWLASGIYIPTATSCFRNSIRFPESFFTALNADTFLWSILGHQGKAIFQHDINLSVRRVHQGGIFSMKDDVYRFQQMLHSYKQMLSVTDDRYKTYLKTKICKTYIILSKTYLKKYNLGKSISNFLQSLSFLQLNQYGFKSFMKVIFK